MLFRFFAMFSLSLLYTEVARFPSQSWRMLSQWQKMVGWPHIQTLAQACQSQWGNLSFAFFIGGSGEEEDFRFLWESINSVYIFVLFGWTLCWQKKCQAIRLQGMKTLKYAHYETFIHCRTNFRNLYLLASSLYAKSICYIAVLNKTAKRWYDNVY